MTGSGSVTEKLLPRVRVTKGAGGPGTEGGTIMSGSKKYIHLVRGSVHSDAVTKRPCQQRTNGCCCHPLGISTPAPKNGVQYNVGKESG